MRASRYGVPEEVWSLIRAEQLVLLKGCGQRKVPGLPVDP